MTSSIEYASGLIKNDYKHVLEFGVYEGGTISKLRANLSQEYKIFGFDSFEGLPEDWIGTVCNKGFFQRMEIFQILKVLIFLKDGLKILFLNI